MLGCAAPAEDPRDGLGQRPRVKPGLQPRLRKPKPIDECSRGIHRTRCPYLLVTVLNVLQDHENFGCHSAVLVGSRWRGMDEGSEGFDQPLRTEQITRELGMVGYRDATHFNRAFSSHPASGLGGRLHPLHPAVGRSQARESTIAPVEFMGVAGGKHLPSQ